MGVNKLAQFRNSLDVDRDSVCVSAEKVFSSSFNGIEVKCMIGHMYISGRWV